MHSQPFPIISYRDEKGNFIHSTNAVAFGLQVGSTVSLPVKNYANVRSLEQFTKDYCDEKKIDPSSLGKAKKVWIFAQYVLLEQPAPNTTYIVVSHHQNNSGNIETIVRRA